MLVMVARSAVLAGLAGINSGEYTLTLALGALSPALEACSLYSGSPASNRRTSRLKISRSSRHLNAGGRSNLPDPLEQHIDMPL